MKWDNRDLFQQLGIKTPENLTEQDIEEAYFEKILELYIKIRLVQENVLEEKKLYKEDMIKEELYRKMREMPSTRVKIMALDQWIDDLGRTKQEKVNFQMQIQKYAEAYEILRNEEKRKEYIRKIVAKKAIEYQLSTLIEQKGGDPSKKLKTYETNIGNNPINVRKKEKDIIPYEVRHEDEEISLSLKDAILFQNNIVKILGKDKVEKLECIKTELIKVEGEREKPVNIEGSNYLMDIDYVIMALGSKPENKILEELGVERTNRGYIKVDENQMTSREKVFAAGDLIEVKSTVAWAARSGRDAGEKIAKYLK